MNAKQLWKESLGHLEKSISKAHLLTYFQDTIIEHVDKDIVVIATSSPFILETIKMRYSEDILKTIKSFIPEVKEIDFVVKEIKKEEKAEIRNIIQTHEVPKIELVEGIASKCLNKKYTLDNYIVGESNELAYAVAREVVRDPGKKYNPYFIYGGVGMGKTHLLQAIGNEILLKNPQAKIVYTTTEGFMNDFIESIGKRQAERFRKKYRNIDVLIIDDIQLFANKEKTQEEFFYTFNTLYEHNKQIVLSSDKKPKEMKGIAERLVSRFKSGMMVEISEPDTETRFAILQKKSQEQSQLIPQEIFKYIAENTKGSIREMEGVLNQLIARISLTKKSPTIDMVEALLDIQPLKRAHKKEETYTDVLEKVAEHYNLSVEDILGTSRKAEYNVPRQITMYIIRKKFNKPYEDIGAIFSNRNHASVIYSVKKIENLLKNDPQLKNTVDRFC